MKHMLRAAKTRAAILLPASCLLFVPATAWPSPGLPPIPSDKPFVRLFNYFTPTPEEAEHLNNLPKAEQERVIDELTSWYGLFHSHRLGFATKGRSETSLAAKLVQKGAVVSNYRNGSYTIGEETTLLEQALPHCIQTWWPGHKSPGSGGSNDPAARLKIDLTPIETEIRLTSPTAYKPALAPESWPYLPSRGAGAVVGNAHSSNTHDFVSWIKINNEIMRVRKVGFAGDTIALTVDRGYFATEATEHKLGARVLSPMYVGSTSASTTDFKFAGSPAVDNPSKSLRHGLTYWKPEAVTWLAARVKAGLGGGETPPGLQGYNAIWLDITSSTSYNTADAFGQPVVTWDDARDQLMTVTARADYQLQKVRKLKEELEKIGVHGAKVIINNVAAGGRSAEADAAQNKMLGDPVVDGGCLENWMFSPNMWNGNMNQHFLIQQHNWPGVYLVYWERGRPDFPPEQHLSFAYGAYLAGWRPTATHSFFGGNFKLKKPPELFFWNWGAPRSNPSSLEELLKQAARAEGNGSEKPVIFRRDFENGIILVNPGPVTARCDLEQQYWDVLDKDGHGRPRLVKSVSLKVGDAAFLMR